jgi:hypothetical protein
MHQVFAFQSSQWSSSRRRHRVLSTVLVLALLLSMVATAAFGANAAVVEAQDNGLSTASISPDSTLVYAALTLDTESDQFTQSQELLDRAGLSSLLDMAFEESEASGDLNPEEIEPFLGGEVALVVTDVAIADAIAESEAVGDAAGDVLGDTAELSESDSELAGAAVVVRAEDPEAAYEQALELLQESADEDAISVDEVDYESVTIETAVDEASPTDGMAIALVDDFVIISATAADIEPFIDVSNGDTDPLTSVEAFEIVQDELNEEFLLFAFIDGPTLKEAILSDPDAEEFAGLASQSMTALDAYTGIVVWADDPGFRLDSISIPSEDAEEVAGAGNYELTLDQQVPADTLLFLDGMDLGNTDLMQALGLVIAQSINGEEPGSGPPDGMDAEEYAEEQFAQAEAMLGFNLRTDLIDQLVGEYALALTVPDIATLMAPDGIFAIFISGVEDPATLSDALSQLTPLLTQGMGETTTVETRDIDGSEVTVISDSSSGFPMQAEYGVVDDQLLVGIGESIDVFREGPVDSLADDPLYQEVMSLLPEEHGGVLYINLGEAIALAQTLAGFAGASDTASIEDASAECAEYATQEEAQAAYDEDPSLFELDQDFDGESCEDYFSGGESASPETEEIAFQDMDLSALQALGMVTFAGEDGIRGTSLIIYIEE